MSEPPATDREGVVDVERDFGRGTAVVTFARGPHNYLTYELLERLIGELELLGDSGCRAVVLRTSSRHFCAGADFAGERPTKRGGPHVFDLVPRLYQLTTPVVAVVGGAAIGAGLGLALAADFRVTNAAAYYLANFNRIGITPGFALSYTLPALVGTQLAGEMLYTARRVSGDEAVRIGLADRLVDEQSIDEAGLALAREIALSSPAAVRGTRALLRASVASGVRDALAAERSDQDQLIDTDDFVEGVQAWREKRVPNFGPTWN